MRLSRTVVLYSSQNPVATPQTRPIAMPVRGQPSRVPSQRPRKNPAAMAMGNTMPMPMRSPHRARSPGLVSFLPVPNHIPMTFRKARWAS